MPKYKDWTNRKTGTRTQVAYGSNGTKTVKVTEAGAVTFTPPKRSAKMLDSKTSLSHTTRPKISIGKGRTTTRTESSKGTTVKTFDPNRSTKKKQEDKKAHGGGLLILPKKTGVLKTVIRRKEPDTFYLATRKATGVDNPTKLGIQKLNLPISSSKAATTPTVSSVKKEIQSLKREKRQDVRKEHKVNKLQAKLEKLKK